MNVLLKTAVPPPMALANGAARAIRRLDPELPINDVRPLTAMVVLSAMMIPARRASRVDPAIALREE